MSVGPVLLFPPFSKPGVTTTVVVIGDVPVFTAVNPISPDPVVVNVKSAFEGAVIEEPINDKSEVIYPESFVLCDIFPALFV